MIPKTLRVRAVGSGLVQHHERFEAPINAANRFIGRSYEPDPTRPGAFRFVATGNTEEVPFRPEYIQALRAGDLEAADEETARAAGLEFTKPAPAPKAEPDPSATPAQKGNDE